MQDQPVDQRRLDKRQGYHTQHWGTLILFLSRYITALQAEQLGILKHRPGPQSRGRQIDKHLFGHQKCLAS